jgi:hypothetical protein
MHEQEFFAARDREIATAPNKAARETLIRALFADDASPAKKALGETFNDTKHAAEAESLFVRTAGRFPLTAVGDVNSYALFAELFSRLIGSEISRAGRAGIIVPTGIATDATTSSFFGWLSREGRLIQFFDFQTAWVSSTISGTRGSSSRGDVGSQQCSRKRARAARVLPPSDGGFRGARPILRVERRGDLVNQSKYENPAHLSLAG